MRLWLSSKVCLDIPSVSLALTNLTAPLTATGDQLVTVRGESDKNDSTSDELDILVTSG